MRRLEIATWGRGDMGSFPGKFFGSSRNRQKCRAFQALLHFREFLLRNQEHGEKCKKLRTTGVETPGRPSRPSPPRYVSQKRVLFRRVRPKGWVPETKRYREASTASTAERAVPSSSAERFFAADCKRSNNHPSSFANVLGFEASSAASCDFADLDGVAAGPLLPLVAAEVGFPKTCADCCCLPATGATWSLPFTVVVVGPNDRGRTMRDSGANDVPGVPTLIFPLKRRATSVVAPADGLEDSGLSFVGAT